MLSCTRKEWEWVGEVMGGHTAGAHGGQQGGQVRADVCAAGKALEGHDRQTIGLL